MQESVLIRASPKLLFVSQHRFPLEMELHPLLHALLKQFLQRLAFRESETI